MWLLLLWSGFRKKSTTGRNLGIAANAPGGNSPRLAASSVASNSLTVDGKAISTIDGPYSGGPGVVYFAGVVAPLAAGNHAYVIQSADSHGNVATSSGNFSVVAASAGAALADQLASRPTPASVLDQVFGSSQDDGSREWS